MREPAHIGGAEGRAEHGHQRRRCGGVSWFASYPCAGEEDRDDGRKLRTRRSRQPKTYPDRDCAPATDAFVRGGEREDGQREAEYGRLALPQRLAGRAP